MSTHGSKRAQPHLEAMRLQQAKIQDLTRGIIQYVDNARADGATWAQIGDALGITKQAAQQHYGYTSQWTAANTAAGLTPSIFNDR